MSKKDKRPKKISAKKEKYLKFKKEKPSAMDLTMPDLSDEQNKLRQQDELSINRFLRFSRNPPTKEIRDKKEKYK